MPDRDLLVTVTVNPAIDLFLTTHGFCACHKLRTDSERMAAGGGGINVARVLHELGGNTLALFLAGGATGQMMQELLTEEGLPHRLIHMHNKTRLCVTAMDEDTGQDYRLVPRGPEIEPAEWRAVLAAVTEAAGGWLIASGSLPSGIPVDAYAQMAAIAAARGQKFVVDTSGQALAATMGCGGIELAKLSLSELESLVGHPVGDKDNQEIEAYDLVKAGAARAIAVTLGEDGAILAHDGGVIRMAALKGPMHCTLGAGDSFLAAMTLAMSRRWSDEAALAYAIATGAAAVADHEAHVHRDEVERRYDDIHYADMYMGGGPAFAAMADAETP